MRMCICRCVQKKKKKVEGGGGGGGGGVESGVVYLRRMPWGPRVSDCYKVVVNILA